VFCAAKQRLFGEVGNARVFRVFVARSRADQDPDCGGFHAGQDLVAFTNTGPTVCNIAGRDAAGTGIFTVTLVVFGLPELIGHLPYFGIMLTLFIAPDADSWQVQRALRRAGISVAYSEGFSPHPQISLAAPLHVGVISSAE